MAALDSYIVAPFKQAEPILRMYPNPAHHARKGLCFGLCVLWLARRKSHGGETPKERIHYIELPTTISEASTRQRKYIDLRDPTAEQMGSRGSVLAEAKLKLNEGETSSIIRSKDSAERVVEWMRVGTGRSHTNHLITLFFAVGTKAASHFTCCYKSGGKAFGLGAHFYFFDPNFGELKAKPDDVADMFTGLMNNYKDYPGAGSTTHVQLQNVTSL